MIILFHTRAVELLVPVIEEFSNVHVISGYDETVNATDNEPSNKSQVLPRGALTQVGTSVGRSGDIAAATQQIQNVPGTSVFIQMPCLELS